MRVVANPTWMAVVTTMLAAAIPATVNADGTLPPTNVDCPVAVCDTRCYGRDRFNMLDYVNGAATPSPASGAATPSPVFVLGAAEVSPPEEVMPDPTPAPTKEPSPAPTESPTTAPTGSPIAAPTDSPTSAPTDSPTSTPTSSPTSTPTGSPTSTPTGSPTSTPTGSPTKAPTPAPTGSPTPIPGLDCEERDLDICVAIDMSGSVCSTNNTVLSCDNCHDLGSGYCVWPGYENNPAQCCDNYVKEMNFTKTFIQLMDDISTTSQQQFSLISFSTNAVQLGTGLTDAAGAIQNVDGLVYKGGWTNTGDAIKACYDTMKGKDNALRTRAIVVVTDGTATTGDDLTATTGTEIDNAKHQAYAEGQSANVQDAEIMVIPVAVNTLQLDINKLLAIASDPSLLVEVKEFEELDLQDTVNQLAAKVKCGSTNPILQGAWVDVSFDDFENGWGDWTKIGDTEEAGNRTSLVKAMDVGTHCPYEEGTSNTGEQCIVLRDDSLTEADTTDVDVYMQSVTVPVQDATKVRVQFDYATQNWKDQDNDHFHLDYQLLDASTTAETAPWIEHTYQIAVNFNNNVDGTMEKWYDIPVEATGMTFRMHIDTNSVSDYLFLDNILVQKFVPAS